MRSATHNIRNSIENFFNWAELGKEVFRKTKELLKFPSVTENTFSYKINNFFNIENLNGHTSIKGKTIALKTGGNIPKFQINPSGSVISTFILKFGKIYQMHSVISQISAVIVRRFLR
jgi:hypothetical protein